MRYLVHVRSVTQVGLTSVPLTSKRRALPSSSRNQLKGACRNFVPRCCYTNDATGAPASMRAFECRTHDFYIPRAIKRVIDAPLSHGAGNVALNCAIHFFWIHTIGGSQLFGHFKLGRTDIDSNNLGCSGLLGSLDNSKSLY